MSPPADKPTRTGGLGSDVVSPSLALLVRQHNRLHNSVWGISPSGTPNDGDYGGFGVEGPGFPYDGFGADASHPKGLSQ
jgi:hypothetical protein